MYRSKALLGKLSCRAQKRRYVRGRGRRLWGLISCQNIQSTVKFTTRLKFSAGLTKYASVMHVARAQGSKGSRPMHVRSAAASSASSVSGLAPLKCTYPAVAAGSGVLKILVAVRRRTLRRKVCYGLGERDLCRFRRCNCDCCSACVSMSGAAEGACTWSLVLALFLCRPEPCTAYV